jgi:lipoyl(octanoyl) transferase
MTMASPTVRLTGSVLTPSTLTYAQAWALQRELVEERLVDRRPDTLLLLEHQPVFTVGRSGRAAHWGGDEQASNIAGIPLYRVERGGSVTYHGPGQLVGYPILFLRQFCEGPKAYMRMLEDVVIRTLARWDIVGRWLDKFPGVWVGDTDPVKIAAIGTRIDRGITMHGFALNVTVDLTPFGHIVPCGLAGCRVTSMAALRGGTITMRNVRHYLTEQFADVFNLEWLEPHDK